MAEKFTLDAADAEAGLSTADAATAAQPSSDLPGLCIGGYMTTLLGAVVGGRAMGQAQAEARAVDNTTSREFSITTVQTAEADNTSLLTT
ncbi:hypothetical protein BB736_025090 (plasmid) [Mycobacterium avium subsp. hominissuis]|uniref:hypothetical protein n=1 Tax=Mycobacterium avium complex (MAC) TaxID=120793 RepID=UPI000A02AAF1|nr:MULTISPECIES: hypothetical protein [Mycobacterium avium complex (MAC)]MCA2261310.1 hypothetical protein [Mycobacterium avium]MCA2281476.1 hypothetical protein [Mycobacterium avium]MCA4732080.1 hypothetical protein [Mycobacterium avium subsp. hominissuis]MCF1815601.1 hypothetical protein [Mycobacterium intracellulare subsp. intracellulare]MDO2360819.1 hypothetical protein [Mycobacterium avium subsp. hominissuis]